VDGGVVTQESSLLIEHSDIRPTYCFTTVMTRYACRLEEMFGHMKAHTDRWIEQKEKERKGGVDSSEFCCCSRRGENE